MKQLGTRRAETSLTIQNWNAKKKTKYSPPTIRWELATWETEGSPVKARMSICPLGVWNSQEWMYFLWKPDNPLNLHLPSTFEIDRVVRECSILLNDRKLLAKLSSGDMVAIEAKYHVRCLVSLYNRATPLRASTSTDTQNSGPSLDELAITELIAYIEESPQTFHID